MKKKASAFVSLAVLLSTPVTWAEDATNTVRAKPAAQKSIWRDTQTGDLQVAVGFRQSTLSSVRDDLNVGTSQAPFVQIFGTLATLGPVGLDLELGGGPNRYTIQQGTAASAFSYTSVEPALGVRAQIIGTGSRRDAFGAALVAGGGASWLLEKKCEATSVSSSTGECPFSDAANAMVPFYRASLELRLRGGYGLRLTGEQRTADVTPGTLGRSTTMMATLFFNATEIFDETR